MENGDGGLDRAGDEDDGASLVNIARRAFERWVRNSVKVSESDIESKRSIAMSVSHVS